MIHRKVSLVAWLTVSVLMLSLNSAYSQKKIKSVSFDGKPQREISQNSNSISLSYTIPSAEITSFQFEGQDFQLVQISNFGLHQQIGEPSVPVRTEKIALPANTQPVVRIIGSKFIEKDVQLIYPAQITSEYASGSVSDIKIDQAVYSANDFYPGELAKVADIQVMKGVPIAYLKVFPAQYNPVTGKVRIYTSLDIQVDFTPQISVKTLFKQKQASYSGKTFLKNATLNPEVVHTYEVSTSPGPISVNDPESYIILTVPRYEAAAEKLASWKRQMGYFVEVISQPTWTTYQVKNAIQSRYDSWEIPPSYSLFIGDQEDIPAQVKSAIDEKYGDWEHWYIDLYYSCMDGYTDKLPDIAHGRIPVNTSEEAMTVVNKIIEYEKNPPTEDRFYQNGIHCAYFEEKKNSEGEGTGEADKRYVYSAEESRNYMMGQGYQVERVYVTEDDVVPDRWSYHYVGGGQVPDELRRPNFAWDGNKEDIIEGVNEGVFYIFHRDHGLIQGWRDPEINNEDVDRMTNGNKLPVIFSVNCHTGRFQQSVKCFAEKLLQKENGGAVGIVAATEETYSGYNDALIEGFLDAIWPDPGLIPKFGSGEEAVDIVDLVPHEAIYTMGDVFNQGLFRMMETWDGWATQRQYERFHYFGDPAMRIWTAKPEQITAEHVLALEPGMTSLSISSSNCPNGLATLCYNNDLKAKVQLVDGNGTLYLEEPVSEDIFGAVLTISAHNYKPLIVELPMANAPEVDFTADLRVICEDQEVHFTDLSTEVPTSWEWLIAPGTIEFTEGTNAHSQHPVIRFLEAGNYSVTLLAQNDYGFGDLQKTSFIIAAGRPSHPLVNDAVICDQGSATLSAAETTGQFRWWDSAEEGNLLSEGRIFETPLLTESTGYFAEAIESLSIAGEDITCISERIEVQVSVINTPEPPTAQDASICFNDSTPVLSAEGMSLKWYADVSCEELLAESDNYQPDDRTTGENQYFVTQTEAICESLPDTLILTVLPEVPSPVVADQELCENDSLTVVARGENITWYRSTPDKSLFVCNSDTLKLSGLTAGEYLFHAESKVGACLSDLASCLVRVNNQPEKPQVEDRSVCIGDSLEIEAVGETIRWYADSFSELLLAEGSVIQHKATAPGEYVYYASQTVSDCESELSKSLIAVNQIPVFSLGEDFEMPFETDTFLTTGMEGTLLWSDGTSDSQISVSGSEYGAGDHLVWLEVTNSTNCTGTDSLLITVLQPNDLHPGTSELSIFIYPNPVTEILHLQLEGNLPEHSVIALTDLQGRAIMQQEIIENTSAETFDFDLSSLSKGVYLITVDNKEITQSFRVVLK